jgi:hypothetical protein
MSRKFSLAVLAAIGAVAVCAMAAPVRADSLQDNKNTWRNLAIGSGAVAAYGLTHHKDTITLLGAAGTAYSLQRYEDARHQQSLVQNGSGSDMRWHGHDERWHRREYRGHHDEHRDHRDWHGRGEHRGWDRGRHNPHHDHDH